MSIADYLNKIKTKITEKYGYKDIVASVIKEIVGIELERDQIKKKYNHISIETRPLIKTEIILKKQQILNKLKEKGMTIEDIK